MGWGEVKIKNMTTKIFTEAKAYNPPGHHSMVALKLHDKELSGTEKFWMGLSHFLPNGGAEWAYEDSPTEKIYFVMEGEVTVNTKTETIILKNTTAYTSNLLKEGK